MKTFTFLFVMIIAAGLNSTRAQDSWIQKANFGGTKRTYAASFSIGDKGYIGTGDNGSSLYLKDFWEYDPATDVWTQKADFGGGVRSGATAFSIGNKGYMGTGDYAFFVPSLKDFWEYDPDANIWTQKADFGGEARSDAVGFSIGNKGYIGTGIQYGYSGDQKIYYNDFWQYDPATDVWTEKAHFGGEVRFFAAGFSIDDKGYLGTGQNPQHIYADLWEYNPSTNIWTKKADMETGRWGAVGFSIGSKGYLGTGNNGNYNSYPNDFWEYDPGTNTWDQKADFGGASRWSAVGFSIGNKGYLGTGWTGDLLKHDVWEYTPGVAPPCDIPTNLSVTNITSSSARLNWSTVSGAEGYKIRYKIAGTNVWTKKETYNSSRTINGLSPNTAYKWEVKTYCHLGAPSVSSDWSSKQDFTTAPFRLSEEPSPLISFQIYPNPAEDHATIQFTLAQSSHVSIKVYDVSGKERETVLNEDVDQGDHSIMLNTTHFSKGVYLVKLISDFGIENQKLMVQ